MPEMNGFELARRIYEIDKDIKIVIINAFDQVTTKEEITKLLPSTRINTLIRKPVEMMKLIDHLSIVLGSNYKRDESFQYLFPNFYSKHHWHNNANANFVTD